MTKEITRPAGSPLRRPLAACALGLLLSGGAASGQGGTSTAQNPLVTFASPGTKEVTLEACNDAGCTQVSRAVVVLDPVPRIVVLDSVPARIGQGQSVHFRADTEGRAPLAHTWTVTGPDSTSILDGNPADWSTAGSTLGGYQARLEVVNGDGAALSEALPLEVVRMTFGDVPPSYFAWLHVETLYANGVTSGCGGPPLVYCPTSVVSREQMAIFLLRAREGSAYVPPPCAAPLFADVPCSDPHAPWINELVARGITAGCGSGNYCPKGQVTREQMAVFLLKAKEGEAYAPPACAAPLFGDVPCSSPFAPWINELVARGITAGCGSGNYCPLAGVTRAQMAIFLTVTFALPPPS